jgi:hypothetical protein
MAKGNYHARRDTGVYATRGASERIITEAVAFVHCRR